MQKRTVNISIFIFFLILLATPWLINEFKKKEKTKAKNSNEALALKRYGFYLKEVSSKIGINFKHETPRLDSSLSNIMPEVASMGASVSVADFNDDGWEDIYLTNSRKGTKNALYENEGNGHFKNVASKMGVAKLNTDKKGVSTGAVWGDYDNDGYPDLFVYRWGKPVLYHNDHGKGFTKVPESKTHFPKWVNANTAIWLDYNDDGNLDLFIGGYYRSDIDLWHLNTTKIMPASFEYADNGGHNYLFRNNGDGTFTNVTKKMGLNSTRWTLAAGAADLNGSGYPDLMIANDYAIDQLYINQHGKHFKLDRHSKIGFAPKSGMNVAFGDVLNQGKFDIYITNISQPGVLIQGNNLWVPSSNGGEKRLNYKDLAKNMGVALGGWSYGAQFGDLNDDGFLDLYVTNGEVSDKKGTDYWYDFSKVAGGNKHVIANAKHWPAMKGRSLSGYEQNRIWLNDGAGKFHEVSNAVGGGLKLDGRSVAFADLWNNGALDIIVASRKGRVKVYKNTVAKDHNWIGFKLIGTKSNRSAIGASVELYWGDQKQKQVITGGSGFSSESQRRVYFGLGTHSKIKKVVIHWPSRQKQVLKSLKVNRLHTIKEPK